MANTLPSQLVPDTAADTAITVLSSALTSITGFASDFSSDLMDPKRPVNIAVVTEGSTTLENPTDFEQGDSTVEFTQVAPTQYSQPFHITNAELQSGHKMERLFEVNLNKLARKIQDVAFAPIVKADFSESTVVANAADMTVADLKEIWGKCSDFDEKRMVLSGAYYANILPDTRENFALTNGAYGYDSIDYSNRLGTSNVETGLEGFVADRKALVMASRVPEMTEMVRDGLYSSTIIDIPDIGISVQFNMWASLKGRDSWASFDICFGAAKADVTALHRIVNTAD